MNKRKAKKKTKSWWKNEVKAKPTLGTIYLEYLRKVQEVFNDRQTQGD